MEADVYTWHYAVAAVLFVVLGVVGHVFRAVFNLYPDRLSDKPIMDMIISDDYNLSDRIFGTEYDDGGFYKLDSAKNLRLSVTFTLIGGMIALLITPGADTVLAYGINESLVWLFDLAKMRVEEFRI